MLILSLCTYMRLLMQISFPAIAVLISSIILDQKLLIVLILDERLLIMLILDERLLIMHT